MPAFVELSDPPHHQLMLMRSGKLERTRWGGAAPVPKPVRYVLLGPLPSSGELRPNLAAGWLAADGATIQLDWFASESVRPGDAQLEYMRRCAQAAMLAGLI